MSSIQRGQPGQGSFELGSKKKFGKNLNKLQKPPAPPITNGASQKGTGSSRNGLLLLSTKRSTSVGSTQGSGLLSGKPVQSSPSAKQASQPNKFRKESYTSAHDALIDAVMGASRNDSQKEPDAWGTVEKQPYEEKVAPTPALPSAQDISRFSDKGGPSDGNNNQSYQPEKIIQERHGDLHDNGETRRYSRHNTEDNPRKSDADENWPRSVPLSEPAENEQGLRMSLLARERAETHRQEEETRMNEYRDRARQRLRELEEKIGSEQNEASDPDHNDKREGTNGFSPPANATRSLYDPNKPYSMLVGGSAKEDYTETPAGYLSQDALGNDDGNGTSAVPPSAPVIHLTSYEDRDRGESRNSNTAPRMLYDPKSGSMVAVSENKAKKIKPKGRREVEKGDNGDLTTNSKKKGKGRTENTVILKKERRRGDSIDINPVDETKTSKSRNIHPAENRLPRTCGVLYVRDDKGNCYSADGCDGDQGYGCHGVPGGRTRNPIAFAKVEQQRVQVADNEDDYIDDIEQELQGYNSPEKAQEQIIDWVKPNEKIELLTGIQDSPTLQATAMPWAPSQAALSAAKERKENHEKVTKSVVSVDSMDDEDDDEYIGDDPDAFIGLGFDPSNMDDVMGSPSNRAHSTRLDHVDLVALSLGVAASDNKRERSIFGFGSSSTWGSAGSNNGRTDWSVLGTSNGVGAAENQVKAVGTPSFLSLSSNNTWGTAGLPGFGADHGTAD